MDSDNVGVINFKFSKSLQPKLHFSNLINIFEFAIELINPYYASVSSFRFIDKVNKDEDDTKIGWITYISNKQVKDLLPSDINKKTTTKGVIFWVTEAKALSLDESAVQKAIQIREIFKRKGLLKKPVLKYKSSQYTDLANYFILQQLKS